MANVTEQDIERAKAGVSNTGQAALIKKIIATKTVVRVIIGEDESVDLELSVPDKAHAESIRNGYGAAAKLKESDENVGSISLTLAASAVSGCIAGLSDDDAARLVLATGGDRGELVMAALSLYGLDVAAAKALREGEADLPT